MNYDTDSDDNAPNEAEEAPRELYQPTGMLGGACWGLYLAVFRPSGELPQWQEWAVTVLLVGGSAVLLIATHKIWKNRPSRRRWRVAAYAVYLLAFGVFPFIH